MPDREKVIKGIENCITGFYCPSECPYLDECNDLMKPMFVELAKDALVLLKEQETVEPITEHHLFLCPVCKNTLFREQKFCHECGKRIEWEGR